ncbi:hypothetical protein NE237_007105 [Protea cynaroides]|uniref:Uncharacterized protein n=1 Tax=Protea cynaroides TaxID=273540 RepID=A0A9Q0KNT7_9MAGN|nr:hypothetical protein NE237_007105 [Protea cynaroides]
MTESDMNAELYQFLELGIYRHGSSMPFLWTLIVSLALLILDTGFVFAVTIRAPLNLRAKGEIAVSVNPRKWKLKQRNSFSLNERELIVDQRHQEERPLGAYEAFVVLL